VKLKTSVTLNDEREIDEFEALCVYLGRRSSQLATDMVRAEIRRYRRRKHIGEFLTLMVRLRRDHRARQAATSNYVDLAAERRARRA
jgi:hypothetical protein